MDTGSMMKQHIIGGFGSIATTMAEQHKRFGLGRDITMDTGSIIEIHTIIGIEEITAITMGADIANTIEAGIMAEGITKNLAKLQIFLCRHGETEWTLTGQHTSFSDISLTENGRKQAIELQKKLQGIAFHKVIVSPMSRAKETCKLAGFDHQKIIEPYVMEWNYGEYEGITTSQIQEKQRKWNIFDDGTPNGESPDDVADRADHILKKLLHETGNILIFSHAHFSRVLAARWIGLDPSAGKYFYLSVASLSILSYEHDQRVIKHWNISGDL